MPLRHACLLIAAVPLLAACHDLNAFHPTEPSDAGSKDSSPPDARRSEASVTDASRPDSHKDASPEAEAGNACEGGVLALGVCTPTPSCAPGDTTFLCGPNQDENCCSTIDVEGGSFVMGYDRGANGTPEGFQSMTAPSVSISSFSLDAFEITIGRFRKFVNDFTTWRSVNPQSGMGARLNLTPGAGWNPEWDAPDSGIGLPLTSDSLLLALNGTCNSENGVTVVSDYTDEPGPGDNRPMTCISWYEAFMFCIWDGARLPTEAEWEFAAAGGAQQRAYPWSVPASDTTVVPANGNIDETSGGVIGVGESPAGDGLFGHHDLAGNVYEWVRDSPASFMTYSDIPIGGASDPIDLTNDTTASRMLRGGSFDVSAIAARTSARTLTPAIYSTGQGAPVTVRYNDVGARCARPVSKQ